MQAPKAKSYQKVVVLGPRQALAIRDIDEQHKQAKALRDYNPTLNAMADVQAEMRSVLNNAAQQQAQSTTKKRKRNGNATAQLAHYNACLERLQALKSQFDTSYDPLLQLLMQNITAKGVAVAPKANPAAPAAAVPEAESAASSEAASEFGTPPQASREPSPDRARVADEALTPPQSTAASTSAAAASSARRSSHGKSTVELSQLLNVIPKKYREKAKQLYEYLERDPAVLHMSDNGRLVVNGSVVHGSSYIDAVRALYTRLLGGVETSTLGLGKLLDALNTLGVPPSLISSTAVRGQYMLRKKASSESVGLTGHTSRYEPQSGEGLVVNQLPSECFPGRPIKCLRLY
jgi:hypothetical protein